MCLSTPTPIAFTATPKRGVSGIAVTLYTAEGDVQSTTTDGDGRYSFGGLDVGYCDYVVLGPHEGWSATTPESGGIYFAGESDAAGPDFGLSHASSVSGTMLVDQDGTGTYTAGDGGIGNIGAYHDVNRNGVYDPGEPLVYSAADGTFQLGNIISDHTGCDQIRILPPVGWAPTTPNGDLIYLDPDSSATGINILLSPTATGIVYGNVHIVSDGGDNNVGLSGLSLTISAWNGYHVTTTTDAAGNYSFAGLTPRSYSISVTPPDNWTLATSNPLSVTITPSSPEVSGQDFGLTAVPPPPNYGSIAGTVYNDRNADASRQGDEPGLSGVSVWANGVDAYGNLTGEQFFTQTDGSGQYNFDMLTPGGNYRIEASQDGRRPTGAQDTLVYNLDPANPHVSAMDVGLTAGIIQGSAFDVAALQPVGGLTVTLTGPSGTQTDSSGGFSFYDLDPFASYTVSIETGNGYRGASETVRPADFSDFLASVELQVVHAPCVVSGKVFEDVDGDGSQGAGEEGQSAWSIYADENGNGAQDGQEPGTTTAADGTYTLTGIAPTADLKIRAVPQPGWSAPAPQSPSLSLGSSETGGIDFPVRRLGSICGTLFEDWNFNETREQDELGLSGWDVFSDSNNNGILDPGELCTTTLQDGAFRLDNIDLGVVQYIRTESRAGWKKTGPADSPDITLTSYDTSTTVFLGETRDDVDDPAWLTFLTSENADLDPENKSIWVSRYVSDKDLPTSTLFDETNEDPNNFRIEVYDPAAAAIAVESATVRMDVIRNNSSVGTYEYDLRSTGSEGGPEAGKYRSEFLRLVSDQIDDAASGFGSNSDPGNQTILVELGDTLRLTYNAHSGRTLTRETVVCRDAKTVKLHINVIRDSINGPAPITTAGVAADVAFARQRYAQAGIKIEYVVNTFNPPTGVDPTDGIDLSTSFNRDQKLNLTNEEKALIGNGPIRDPAGGVVEVFYVKSLSGAYGNSYPAADVDNPIYANVSIIVATSNTRPDYGLLAHEVGHVLTNTGNHYTLSPLDANISVAAEDLMADGSIAATTNSLHASKRLTTEQIGQFRGSPLAK